MSRRRANWPGLLVIVLAAICLEGNKCGTEQTVVNRSVTYRKLVYNSQTGRKTGARAVVSIGSKMPGYYILRKLPPFPP
jgi:hypothetical protein